MENMGRENSGHFRNKKWKFWTVNLQNWDE